MEPRDDKEISRILVVNAHPDDADFGTGGTVAQWTAKGIEVTYVCCTNGDQGGEESDVPLEEMAKVRQKEQRAA